MSESVHQAGEEISLPCQAEGYPEPRVRWLKNNAGLPQSERIVVDSANTLTIKRASPIGKTPLSRIISTGSVQTEGSTPAGPGTMTPLTRPRSL